MAATPKTELIQAARSGRTGKVWQPDVAKRILDALSMGLSMPMACNRARVAVSSVYARAKADPDFAEDIMAARAECALLDLAIIRDASVKDWRAAEAHLRLTFPETYGRNAREQDVSGEEDKPVRIEIQMNSGAWNPTGDEG